MEKMNRLNQHYHYGLLMLEKMILASMVQLCVKKQKNSKKMGKDNFIASEGWFHRWKKRENIVYKRTYREQKDADFSAAESWIKTEWPKIISEYTSNKVYNADETGLFLSCFT